LVSFAPSVLLTTVTRISRSGFGAPLFVSLCAGAGAGAVAPRPPRADPVAGAFRVPRPAPPVPAAAPPLARPPPAAPPDRPAPVAGADVRRGGTGGVLRIDAAGMIAMSGDTRTDNAGTTSSSVRFSPLKMSPSYRYST